jgi:hypothetical protein
LAVSFLDHQALDEPLAIGREVGHPRYLLVGEANQGEAVLGTELIDEESHRLLGRIDFPALPHAAGHVEHEGYRYGLVALDREVLDLLGDALIGQFEVLGVEAGDDSAPLILYAGRKEDQPYGDFLLVLKPQEPLDRRIVELPLPPGATATEPGSTARVDAIPTAAANMAPKITRFSRILSPLLRLLNVQSSSHPSHGRPEKSIEVTTRRREKASKAGDNSGEQYAFVMRHRGARSDRIEVRSDTSPSGPPAKSWRCRSH